jgi:hypothetical protein
MNWKGFERMQSQPNQGIILLLAWMNRGNYKRPVGIAGVSAKIQTKHLLNKSLWHYLYTSSLGVIWSKESRK